MQDALTVTVSMFWWIGIETDLNKTKAMVYTPGFIWGYYGGLFYKRRATGGGVQGVEEDEGVMQHMHSDSGGVLP